MKSSKLSEAKRVERRALIMGKRTYMRREHEPRLAAIPEPIKHSSTRQRARYARQIAAGQIGNRPDHH